MKRKNILLIAGIIILGLIAFLGFSYHANVEANPWDCLVYNYTDGHDVCVLWGLSSSCGFYYAPKISNGQILCPENIMPVFVNGYVACDIGHRYCGMTRPV